VVAVSKAYLKSKLPARVRHALRRAWLRLASVLNRGSRVECPCCGRRLRKFARFYGEAEQCPSCGSLMRHRALLLYLRDVLRLGSKPVRFLHVAPNKGLMRWLRALPGLEYVSADLNSPLAMVHADVTDLPFGDAEFDMLVCAHVLEHVPDDRRAIGEFFRVLRPGGTAILQVPPDDVEATFEDFSITDPRERERVFDQYDHVRLCGPDYIERIAGVGFEAARVDHVESLGPAVRAEHGLRVGEPFYLAIKPEGALPAAAPDRQPTHAIRRISVVAPMYNEADHVASVVSDLAAQDFDGEIELIVADGGSTDGSVARLRAACEEHGLAVTVLDNPERYVSHGLNRCVRAATGDLIARVDCHSRYPADYLRRCAIAAEETGAANVGGIFLPAGRTATERAVACAMDSPFGGIHWTRHAGCARVEVDTVPYGAFRPEAFERAGLFDETLVRNQDDEFNLRLRLAGGRIVQDSSIKIEYIPRGSFAAVFRQYFEYGLWKPAVMRKHGRATSARSLVPVGLVASMAALLVLAPWIHAALLLLELEVGLYAAGALAFGSLSLRRRREPLRLLPRVAAAYPAFHLAHGLGQLTGWARLARWRTPRARNAQANA
jgi:glycosyltransferase involved in cell wall biosynthesis/SAM-dependent methyltransferase